MAAIFRPICCKARFCREIGFSKTRLLRVFFGAVFYAQRRPLGGTLVVWSVVEQLFAFGQDALGEFGMVIGIQGFHHFVCSKQAGFA